MLVDKGPQSWMQTAISAISLLCKNLTEYIWTDFLAYGSNEIVKVHIVVNDCAEG